MDSIIDEVSLCESFFFFTRHLKCRHFILNYDVSSFIINHALAFLLQKDPVPRRWSLFVGFSFTLMMRFNFENVQTYSVQKESLHSEEGLYSKCEELHGFMHNVSQNQRVISVFTKNNRDFLQTWGQQIELDQC